MLGCLGAKVLAVAKHQFVFREGDPANLVGIVLEGCVQMIREDYYGNRSIVARIEPAGLFGESFACADVETFPISVVAVESVKVTVSTPLFWKVPMPILSRPLGRTTVFRFSVLRKL